MMKLKYIERTKMNYMILMLSLVYMRRNGGLISEFRKASKYKNLFGDRNIEKA